MDAELPDAAEANNSTSSNNHFSSNNDNGTHSRKRKAASSAAGGRGVASLTPEQLAKKRQNDREAQRAIRERTRHTIQELERRIRELEAQQPYQDLQLVVRQKEAIQAENDEIRRRLSSVLAIIQPVVGAQRLTDLASAAHHDGSTAQPANAFQQEAGFLSDPTDLGQVQVQVQQADAYMFPPAPEVPSPSDSRGGGGGGAGGWQASTGRGADGIDPSRNGNNSNNNGSSIVDRGLSFSDSGDRNTFNLLLSSLGQRDSSQPPNNHRQQHYIASDEPIWQQLPRHAEPTCALDSVLLSFYDSQRASSEQTIPAYPNVSCLVDDDAAAAAAAADDDDQLDPVSKVTTAMAKFGAAGISSMPERAAIVLLAFVLLRWQAHPTEANYGRVPDWLRPTPAQLATPHAPWIDLVHWPQLRERLVASVPATASSTYPDLPAGLDGNNGAGSNGSPFAAYAAGLSVNWPYEPGDCLLKVPAPPGPAGTAKTIFNPVFEQHVRRLDNWSASLSAGLVDAFPALDIAAAAPAKQLDVVAAAAAAAALANTAGAGAGAGSAR